MSVEIAKGGTRAEVPRPHPRPRVSVVVPAHDEAATLPALWARVAPVLDELESAGLEVQVVVVDDGSRDDTGAVARALLGRDPRLTLVRLTRRFGHQPAVLAGLAHARGDCVVVMDADLQDPPELLPEMVARWREGFQVVYGVRRRRDADSWFKRVTARGFQRLLGRLTAGRYQSDIGDFALLDREVVELLLSHRAPRPFLRGAVAQSGYRHTGVPYDRAPRAAGRTKYPVWRMVALAVDAVVSLTWAPLRLATVAGVAAIAASAVALALGAGLLGAGLIFLGGVQLVALGLLGEYVGRVHQMVAGSPRYLVREVVEAPEESP